MKSSAGVTGGCRRVLLAQGLLGPHMPLHAQAPGQIPGLVKAPPAQTLPAHRHPGDGIELAVIRLASKPIKDAFGRTQLHALGATHGQVGGNDAIPVDIAAAESLITLTQRDDQTQGESQ